ncbi:MAG: hypothetical protein HZB59_09525 [Ignavibacteriales bacterium]|nr:hypothetical protein [Ignavibacteriales bacterium]
MNTIEIQYNYFKDLERLTKTGLYSYLFIFVWFGIIATVGTKNIFTLMLYPELCEVFLILLGSINLFQIIKLISDKIQWLGEFHIWLDNKLFRFLYKSNEIILRELLILLEPKERSVLDQLTSDKRTLIAQSVFAKLSEDQSIFADLLRRGIFRSWIWYWITMYGISIFLLLTVVSAIKIIFLPTIYSKVLFISIGSFAGLQIVLGLILGYNLIRVTKKIIREITDLHGIEIITLLRSQMK